VLTASGAADYALKKLATRPILDSRAVPHAEQAKTQLARFLQK